MNRAKSCSARWGWKNRGVSVRAEKVEWCDGKEETNERTTSVDQIINHGLHVAIASVWALNITSCTDVTFLYYSKVVTACCNLYTLGSLGSDEFKLWFDLFLNALYRSVLISWMVLCEIHKTVMEFREFRMRTHSYWIWKTVIF